jgi:hypothetical protein
MKSRLFFLTTLFLIAAQDVPPLAILSPRAGEIVLGQLSIIGSTDIANFASARLDFKYASDIIPEGGSAENWFFLQTLGQPARETPLYLWDTTTITDGDYILRLRVTLVDGTFQEVTVPVTIQNDSPIATPTPGFTATPEPSIGILVPTPFFLAVSPTPTEVPRPTPTALPENPAALNQNAIVGSLGRGALVIIGLFIFAGISLRLRRP